MEQSTLKISYFILFLTILEHPVVVDVCIFTQKTPMVFHVENAFISYISIYMYEPCNLKQRIIVLLKAINFNGWPE